MAAFYNSTVLLYAEPRAPTQLEISFNQPGETNNTPHSQQSNFVGGIKVMMKTKDLATLPSINRRESEQTLTVGLIHSHICVDVSPRIEMFFAKTILYAKYRARSEAHAGSEPRSMNDSKVFGQTAKKWVELL